MSKRIAAFPDYSIAGLVVTQLRDYGLSPLEIDKGSHVFVAGADQFYYVEVDDHEVDRARDAIKALGHGSKLL